jgi:hypothetical protein
VRFPAARGSNQVVVPVTGTKVWVLAAKAVPFHHVVVLVSSMATLVLAMVVPGTDEAVPVTGPVQSDPYLVPFTG